MSLLGSREQRTLLEVARLAVTSAVERRQSLEVLPSGEALDRPAAAFVTLRRGDRLRGCIGQLAATDPLVRVVADCAKAAALEDPRFEAVCREELLKLQIEISVLSALKEISPENVEVGKHGLLVSRGWLRGVLLPQVAVEFRWARERFLEETCAKAGLDRNAWRDPETRILAFTAEVFSESDLGLLPQPRRAPRYSSST